MRILGRKLRRAAPQLGLIALAGLLVITLQAATKPEAAKAPQSAAGTPVPLIIPQPKDVRMRQGRFTLPKDGRWTLRATSRDERLWRASQSILGGNRGRFQTTDAGLVSLSAGVVSQESMEDRPREAKWAANPEGYELSITTNGLLIRASTPQGVFYGLQTLAQLGAADDAGASFHCAEIQDWPAMRFRGVHWFPSASGVRMHQKLITNVFAALKFNSSVIQCEAARWDKHPEIDAPNAISKNDLRNLVEECRASYLDPIPLLNVPGHAEWIFRNGSNLDFAEDPQTPYAYCVNNPRSFDFIQNVLNECLPVFRSKFCHIGHDEVTMRGRFPNPDCSRCKDSAVTELVVQHANRVTDWLAQRGVQSMIWGDMLLGPGEARDATHAKSLDEARQRRSGISKQTMIVDWHYAASADARSIKILQHGGFRVVAASWYVPANIQHLSQAALAAGAEGLLQTTWMGYFPDERAMRTELRQFAAFILAAEYSWSGRAESPADLGYDPEAQFRKRYEAQR